MHEGSRENVVSIFSTHTDAHFHPLAAGSEEVLGDLPKQIGINPDVDTMLQ